jgi:hypothetical protein
MESKGLPGCFFFSADGTMSSIDGIGDAPEVRILRSKIPSEIDAGL